MLSAFLEAIRATVQPCTLLLLVPPTIMAIVTRARWAALAAIGVGAVLGGWLFIANVVALDGWQLQLSGALVIGSIVVVLLAASVPTLHWAATPTAEAAVAGFVTFVSTLWWRPCVGEQLGVILTGARSGVVGQLPAMAAYMLGAMVPVLGVALVVRAVDPTPLATRRAGWSAGAIGLVVAAAVAIGRHDELVTTLTRWTTS